MDGSSAPLPGETDADGHYLKAIAACGDQRSMVVSQAIYSANGIKLLDTGARIDSRVLDRLFGHNLAEPIDQCVSAQDAVHHKDLVARARELVAVTPLLMHFEASLQQRSQRLWSALATCPLPPAVAMRLTVARDTVPTLYEHALRAAFLALFIASCARFSERDLQLLATAALLHDLGMMHADPALYESERPLDVAGRRNLFAHPLIGQMIAQREPLLSPVIAAAIAQHHERLDGTGYPRGLEGEAIGKLARVLMLVEVVLAILEHEVEQPALQTSLILRLNHRGFDAGVADVMLGALPRLQLGLDAKTCSCPESDRVAALIDAWPQLRTAMPPPAGDAASEFIDQRVGRLRRWLADAGLGDPKAAAAAASEDPSVCAELVALAREGLWQVRQIAYDAQHRWPELAAEQGSAAAGAAHAWVSRARAPGALNPG
jgi:HD-GYP domain-containing protein (c-di-GMP phosphodiesterase class II)